MTKVFHHGYLLVGDIEAGLKAGVDMTCKLLGVEEEKLNSHPDFFLLKTDSLSINDARRIRESSSKKSFSGKGRIFLIQTNFFSKEAVNALLKTLEEPAGLSHFFIVVSSLENILPTLRSRLLVLNFPSTKKLEKEKEVFVQKFLKSFPSKRMEMIKQIAEEKDKTLNFLDGLEIVLAENLRSKFSKEFIQSFDEIEGHRRFLFDRSPSPKMILEHLCLALPMLK